MSSEERLAAGARGSGPVSGDRAGTDGRRSRGGAGLTGVATWPSRCTASKGRVRFSKTPSVSPGATRGRAVGRSAGGVFQHGNCYIELLEPLHEDTGVARFLRRRGEGIHHIALAAADLEAAMGHVRERTPGALLTTPRPRPAAPGRRFAAQAHVRRPHRVVRRD